MLAHKMFVGMPRREAAVAGAIQSLDLLLPIQWHPSARSLAETAIQQTRFTSLLVAMTPAAERPLADPEQLRRLHLVELRRLVAIQNAPERHHSHTLTGSVRRIRDLQKGRNYRTDRVLPKPDDGAHSVFV